MTKDHEFPSVIYLLVFSSDLQSRKKMRLCVLCEREPLNTAGKTENSVCPARWVVGLEQQRRWRIVGGVELHTFVVARQDSWYNTVHRSCVTMLINFLCLKKTAFNRGLLSFTLKEPFFINPNGVGLLDIA